MEDAERATARVGAEEELAAMAEEGVARAVMEAVAEAVAWMGHCTARSQRPSRRRQPR